MVRSLGRAKAVPAFEKNAAMVAVRDLSKALG